MTWIVTFGNFWRIKLRYVPGLQRSTQNSLSVKPTAHKGVACWNQSIIIWGSPPVIYFTLQVRLNTPYLTSDCIVTGL